MNRGNLSILKMKKFGENLKKMGRGTDCHVAALLAMTGRGIDKDLKAGIIIGKRGRCSDWVSPSSGYEVTAGL